VKAVNVLSSLEGRALGLTGAMVASDPPIGYPGGPMDRQATFLLALSLLIAAAAFVSASGWILFVWDRRADRAGGTAAGTSHATTHSTTHAHHEVHEER
jgi:hypothetical protein